MNNKDYLMHYGVKGQKWGRRRYQNEDGSYKRGAEGRYDPEPKTNPNIVKDKPNDDKVIYKRSILNNKNPYSHRNTAVEARSKDWYKRTKSGSYEAIKSEDRENKGGGPYTYLTASGKKVVNENAKGPQLPASDNGSRKNPYLEKAKEVTEKAVKAVKDNVVIPVKVETAPARQKAAEVISNTKGKVNEVVNKVTDTVKKEADHVVKKATSGLSDNHASSSGKKTTVVDTVKNAANTATQTVSSFVSNAKTTSSSTINAAKSYVSSAKTTASSLVSSSKNAITKAVNWVSSLFKK